MSPLRDTHETEVAEKGWSGWDMLALGAGYTVFPRFGEALLANAQNDVERRVANILIDFKDESDAETPDEEREFWEVRERKTREVFQWCTANADRAFSVKDAKGRKVLSFIGDGLVYFGLNTKSFPAAEEYSTSNDQGWAKWSADCVRVGGILANEDVSSSPEAFAFLSKWLWNIWS